MTFEEKDGEPAFGSSWFARLSRSIAAGRAQKACDEIAVAVRRALAEPASSLPPRWSITELWLRLLEQNEVAYAQWVRSQESELYQGAVGDEARDARTALAGELAGVAAELPTEILVALARSIREDAPEHGESVILGHALRHMSSAQLVADLLARSAPRLLERYELALRGVGSPVGAALPLHHLGGVAIPRNYSRAQRIAIASGCVAIILLPVAFFSMGRKLGSPRSSDANASPERAAQPSWLRELCNAPDQGLCSAGTKIHRASSCDEAFGSLSELEQAAEDLSRRGSLPFSVKRVVLSLREEVQVECMPVPGSQGSPRQSPYSY